MDVSQTKTRTYHRNDVESRLLLREKQLFLKKLDFQLKFLEKLQDDDDIKFPLEIHDKV